MKFIEIVENDSKRLILRHFPLDYWSAWSITLILVLSVISGYSFIKNQYLWLIPVQILVTAYFFLIHFKVVSSIFEKKRKRLIISRKSLLLNRVIQYSFQEVVAVKVVRRRTKVPTYEVQLSFRSGQKTEVNSSGTTEREDAEAIAVLINRTIFGDVEST